MRILFLSAWFPYPPDNGSRIRAYNLMRALSERHEVFLISLLQDDSDPANAVHLKELCEVVSLHESRFYKGGTLKSVLGLLSSRPRSVVDTFDPVVKHAVRSAVERIRPDVIVASTLGVVEYVPNNINIPSVLEEHNCEYAILRRRAEQMSGRIGRYRYDLGWKKFARWEVRVCRKFGAVVMVSEADKRMLLDVAPDLAPVHVVPNGVDTEHYTPTHRAPEPNTIVYNGALTFGANRDAVDYYASDIYPILKLNCPNARLKVTGRTDGVDLTGIADCPGIELTGYVNDIREVLDKSLACVVPLGMGGGSRLKILEAMAAGVPVVSTSVGAEGIKAVNGEHLVIADTAADFARAVASVLTDTERAQEMARKARRLVEGRYSWKSIGRTFADIVEDLTHDRHDGIIVL